MSSVPPLAGISDYEAATRADLSVDETVATLRRLARIERRTMLVLAAHLSAAPEWEVKCALALHLWQDAEHCGWLRDRVPEMRKPPHYLDRPDDPALEAFFDELVHSRSTRELLTGVYRVLKPSLLEAIDSHIRRANPLADQPTLRLLRFLRLEEREQVEWGEAALSALGGADEEWERHLCAYLNAAGGAGGAGERATELPQPRAVESHELVRMPRRDERFTRLWDSRGKLPYDERPADEINWRMLYVRLTEMHAVELVALTLYEWPDASFDVHRDLARHLWDEARHSMFGEAWFETHGVDWQSVPHDLSFASYPATEYEPHERYALLYAAEHMAMKKTGKRAQYEAAAASGDELAALYQDFDWADEVLHVHLARRVLLAHAYKDSKELDEASERIWEDFDQVPEADRRLPRSDWWDEFYAGVRSSTASA